jgi:hypothetical protein
VFPFLAWNRRAEPLGKQSNQRITVNNKKLIIIRKSMQNFLFLTTHDYQSVSTYCNLFVVVDVLLLFCGEGRKKMGRRTDTHRQYQ